MSPPPGVVRAKESTMDKPTPADGCLWTVDATIDKQANDIKTFLEERPDIFEEAISTMVRIEKLRVELTKLLGRDGAEIARKHCQAAAAKRIALNANQSASPRQLPPVQSAPKGGKR